MNIFQASNAITSEQHKYSLRGVLRGHYGAVACIAAHPLGFYLASGGEAGTKIWQVSNAKPLSCPTGVSDRGITTAIVWLTRPDNEDEGLAYGTEHGFLCICNE
ncbi:hypothetical protein C8R42DRAFT_649379 [Lentinula raphanica]|nr:hypothetical protein C8R42DRAFT_649379 [Lentinula raphanica]